MAAVLALMRGAFGRWALIAAALAGAGWWLHAAGYERGYGAHRAETEAATRALNTRLARTDAALRAATDAYRRERRAAADAQRRLADEAIRDPDADRRALGADSVRRIDSVR